MSVLANLAAMQRSESVKGFVQLCAIEIKFLYGCSVPWDKLANAMNASDKSVSASPSPVIEGSAHCTVQAY